jgi:hypothetical protein
MSPIKKVIALVYGLQAFIVAPWFLGAIYRKEQSLWAWEEYGHVAARHGTGEAFLSMYLYVIFYSVPFVGAFLTLLAIPKTRHLPRANAAIISAWVTGTFLLLFSSCAEFVRNIQDTWNGWLVILWCIVSYFIICFLWSVFRRKPQQ